MQNVFFEYVYLVLINLALLEHQRWLVSQMNRKGEVDEEPVGKYLKLIDLEEFKSSGKTIRGLKFL